MKKILLSLFVGLFGLISFGYCEFSCYPFYTEQFTSAGTVTIYDGFDMFCVNSAFRSFKYDLNCEGNYDNVLNQQDSICFTRDEFENNSICTQANGNSYFIGTVVYFNGDCLDEPYSSLQCQTEYNLIPISSVDQNYCVNNGFCPSGGGDCPICPGSGDNWSALYINNIQHLGKPIINITFPDYLDWDYTTTVNEFNLDIVGYPVDTEYIDGIIRTQNYKPTSEDFTQLVGMLAPYSKYLLFLLFVFIIWAWIKKPFKSKKL